MPRLLVFGARGLGRVIAEHLAPQGWDAVGVARSEATAAAFPGRGVVADLTDVERMRAVVAEAAPFDLAVNAMSPKGRFGGGDLTTTDDDAMAPYLEQLLPEVFGFYRTCGAALAERGSGTLVQVTGGSARRALPGRAPWAAGARRCARSARRPQTSSSRRACTPRCWCATAAFGDAGRRRGRRADRPGRARANGAVPARAGPQRLDARAGGDADRRPLDAVI